MKGGEQRMTWNRGAAAALLCFVLLWFGDVSGQIRYSIPEEVKEGTVVGNIVKDLGLDIASLADRRLRIVSGSTDSLFQVKANGALSVHKNIDREELCAESVVCLANVKVVVENPLEIHYVDVEIADVNDHPPAFLGKEQHFDIAEHTILGTRFQVQGARDPDLGANSVRHYKLSQNEHFDIDVRERHEEKIPFIVLKKALDRETRSTHLLTLTAVDGGSPPRSGSLNVTITVLDSNDNRPVFSQETYTVAVEENVAIGTIILTVNATDVDEGSNGEVEYTLGRNLNRRIYEIFQLNNVTGEIRVRGKVDFEDAEVYKLDVHASDRGQPPLTVESGLIIKIIDVNDNAPEIDVTSLSNVVSEDSKPGTAVALISVTDRDSGVNGRVSCTLPPDVPFELKPSFKDNVFSLVTKWRLDREAVSSYDVTITAADLGEPPLSTSRSFSVQISDVNDNWPAFPQNPLDLYCAENVAPGLLIFSVSASDKDLNENAAVTYSIVRKEGAQPDVASVLNINSENGNIYALRSFDFERVKTFQFHVVAKDSGDPPLSSNVTVNVFVLDENDNAPVILSPLSANGSAEGVEDVPRNANAGHLVTKVRAYDADVGYNGWMLFSLQEVTDPTLFGLDRYTGQIRTLRSVTGTDEARHKLVILVKDNGNVSLSATATVLVQFVEPKEAFAAPDMKSPEKQEDESHVTKFYLMVALGSVSGLFLISVIALVAMQCAKPADSSSKYLQDTNYDGTLCHSIQYRSGDKRYMLVGPRMSIGSTIVPGSNANTLIANHGRTASAEDCVYPGWILQHRASQAHSHTGMHADG